MKKMYNVPVVDLAEACFRIASESGKTIAVDTLTPLIHELYGIPQKQHIRKMPAALIPIIAIYWREHGRTRSRVSILNWVKAKNMSIPAFTQYVPSVKTKSADSISADELLEFINRAVDRKWKEQEKRLSGLLLTAN